LPVADRAVRFRSLPDACDAGSATRRYQIYSVQNSRVLKAFEFIARVNLGNAQKAINRTA